MYPIQTYILLVFKLHMDDSKEKQLLNITGLLNKKYIQKKPYIFPHCIYLLGNLRRKAFSVNVWASWECSFGELPFVSVIII